MQNYDSDKKTLYDFIKEEEKFRNHILSIMQKFGESTDNIDIKNIDKIKDFLEDLKFSLNLFNQNIDTLKKISKEIDEISIIEFPNSQNVTDKPPIVTNKAETNKLPSTIESQNENTSSLDSKKDSIFDENNSKYKENTLIISDITGNVVLPYNIQELTQILEESKNKYSSIDDIIQEKYTLAISKFRNPFVSRFREAFKLIRSKEKGSIKDAFELGLELIFNYNLHPAIISACKNLDELDIYLDYLESSETQKFDIFRIVFEISPSIK